MDGQLLPGNLSSQKEIWRGYTVLVGATKEEPGFETRGTKRGEFLVPDEFTPEERGCAAYTMDGAAQYQAGQMDAFRVDRPNDAIFQERAIQAKRREPSGKLPWRSLLIRLPLAANAGSASFPGVTDLSRRPGAWLHVRMAQTLPIRRAGGKHVWSRAR